MKLDWRQQTGQYQYGYDLYLGDYCIGSIHQPVQSKSYTGPRWRPETTLPGIRVRQGLLFETDEQAKAALERVVLLWLKGIEVPEHIRPA